jgi:methylthioribose-1-phosphate isomerase
MPRMRAGLPVHVWVSETRPRNQGLLTAWELREAGVPHTLIADNAAGLLLMQGKVDLVIVGADRIAANGDTANKVGTYLKALAARAHGVPFYVAAPCRPSISPVPRVRRSRSRSAVPKNSAPAIRRSPIRLST